MTKIYELLNEKTIMADVDEKHHTATISVYILDELVKTVNMTGTWEEDIDDNRKWDRVRFYCSECGNWQTYGKTDFCPSCGAKMFEPQESEE
jgi:rRNA maturation endonuclease Nob1